jgi:hypothetical protein
MPLLYLHVHSKDGFVEDLEGAEFEDLRAARQEARDGIRALVADALFCGKELLVRSVDITDNEGTQLEQVTLAEAISGVIPIDDAFIQEVKRLQTSKGPNNLIQ